MIIMKKFSKRIGALLVSAAMLTGMTAVSSGSVLTAVAAGSYAVTSDKLPKTLVIASQEVDADGVPVNKTECTYLARVADLAKSGLKSIQLHFTADQPVAQFAYYAGISLDAKPWWADLTKTGTKCAPYSDDFYLTIDLSGVKVGYDDTYGEKKFEFQNCYAQSAKGEPISITLADVTANGTKDTSEGEAPASGNENTGGAGYATGNSKSGNYNFVDNGDGTATITSTLTKKIDDISAFYQKKWSAGSSSFSGDIVLTPSPDGEDYSEEGYETVDSNGNVIKKSEEEIRKEGLPINSHKFS